MDIENNEKKQEETQQEGFQREARRTPRPRIHTAQRPTFERQDYRRHDNDESGFRPEGFGVQPCLRAIHSVRTTVPVTTMAVATIVPVRDRVVTSPVRAAISLVRDRKEVISLVRVDTSPVREVISSVRVAISHVRARKAVISPVKVDTSNVREAISPVRDRAVDISSVRVVIRNLMASQVIPIRKGRASIQQTTTRMLSIA